MSAAPLGERRNRTRSVGLRAVAAILCRFKRHLLVALLLLISGCATWSRPAPSADLPPECVARYAALLDLAQLAHRDGPDAATFVNAIRELARSLDDGLSEVRPASPASVLPATRPRDKLEPRDDRAGQGNRTVKTAWASTTRGEGDIPII
ncbi:hypothetical protein [Burkholderia sp. AU45388]|uniref:hypothetical protein n=1 Tax=Burkholderia sp. AU45388 TaxID=3059206 RepID=UPI00264AB14A|nr:hypothetical protein [Burkholderia sp. AU45388]MDN7429201.1 hypothetical protein [Burkholderia sp. AU45388]